MQNWFTEKQAKSIAFRSQKSNWRLDGNSYRENKEGKLYSELSREDRAILRKAKQTGKPAYMYKIVNWRVVLK